MKTKDKHIYVYIHGSKNIKDTLLTLQELLVYRENEYSWVEAEMLVRYIHKKPSCKRVSKHQMSSTISQLADTGGRDRGKMGRGSAYTSSQRRYTDGQYVHEKVLNITNH